MFVCWIWPQLREGERAKEGALHVEQNRVMKRFHHPSSAAKELHDLLGKRKKLNVPTLVFRIGGTQTGQDNNEEKAPDHKEGQ